MYEPVVHEYLLLGLRLGRLVDGFVDCWFGDPELFEQVRTEPQVDPVDLAAHAAELLVRLDDSGLDSSRQRFLAAQITALRCTAQRLAGVEMTFKDEVATYFDVEIELGDPDRYASVHDSIAELLPGPNSLRQRVEAFYERNLVPPERLRRSVEAVSHELRAMARPLLGLPDTERIDYEVVRDEPWNAFNRYLGGFRSAVMLNADAGRNIAALPVLVTHESYPGHHAEHCLKEAGLVIGRGQGEHTIALVNTPQCLMAEGTAEMALHALLGPGWGRWTSEILAGEGVRIDGELVERMLALLAQLFIVRQDAAILLHDRGADVDEVVDYLRRWLLLSRDRAEHMVRFLSDPLWRAYTVTYVEGARLVGSWLAAGHSEQTGIERFQVLLREQLLPSILREELGRADSTTPSTGPPNPKETP